MENTTESKKVGIVVRALLFVFGVVTASAGFVVACVLARDHYQYTFVQVWLAIASVVIIVTIGVLLMACGLGGRNANSNGLGKEASA